MAERQLRDRSPGKTATALRKRRRMTESIRNWVSYYGNLAVSLTCILIIWYFAAHWVDDSFKFPMIEDILACKSIGVKLETANSIDL